MSDLIKHIDDLQSQLTSKEQEVERLREALEQYVRAFEIADKGDPLIEVAMDRRIVEADRKTLANNGGKG